MSPVEEKIGTRKVSRKKKTAAKVVAKETVPLTIDYPAKGEIISSSEYVVRLSSVPGYRVEISIDGGDWNLCRESAGFWWFDWANYPVGSHTISAQVVDADGKVLKKVKTNCSYRPA